eukprot:TRINITY_DN5503_c0_g1_i1.p1 TRINITY_DN5503_c0_g1~~TRINITY_DN5503_c0_g1_i1.p1  ORF type:complete len:195 (+),score=66.24 TRINITY_DN5503_c0_g1_i1:66-587(+)
MSETNSESKIEEKKHADVTKISRGVNENTEGLPFFMKGKVIHGFGRGSKQLGCPTANLPIEGYNECINKLPNGVYYGWASVENGPVYKMAMNIGWSPYFGNKEKTLEIHVIHEYEGDFYDKELKAVALGYIREELNFGSLDDLIQAIKDDISWTVSKLEEEPYNKFKSDKYFN